jgi:hypothetical protein
MFSGLLPPENRPPICARYVHPLLCQEAAISKYCPMDLPAGVSISTYTHAETGYANPHAVTSIGNGLSSTTHGYDAFGARVYPQYTPREYARWRYARELALSPCSMKRARQFVL